MPLAANTFGKRQLVVRTPGKEPGFHVLMPDVMPGLHLPVCLAQFRQHLFLVGNVGLNGIGDEKIRAAAGGLCQPGQPLFGGRFQPDTKS